MSDTGDGLETRESDILSFDVSDETIERATQSKATVANPTVPSALICIPFELKASA